MRRALLLALLLAGCDGGRPVAQPATPGARLEASAVAAGLVVDPRSASEIGSWSRDGDRVCVVPADNDDERIGALVDYGDGQGCAASGTAERHGERLDVIFGSCRFAARFDGTRIVFPAELPGACDTLCTGRASLAALAMTRISGSASEARTLRSPGGRLLCAS